MQLEHSNDRKNSRKLKKLIEANHQLAKIESLEELVPILLDLARDVTRAQASSFLLFDFRERALRFAAIKDETLSLITSRSLKRSIKIPLGRGIAGWVAHHQLPLIIDDAQHHPLFFDQVDRSTGFVTRSLLAVPVSHGQELLGVIEVLNAKGRPCFDQHDQDLLVSFSDLAAVAIIRARLLTERLQQQAMRIQMETAAKIQSLFRPELPTLGQGSSIWAYSQPAQFVGGDLYDIIPVGHDRWLAYVADVSDKGLPAALIMAALWYRIRSEAYRHDNVGKLLQRLNATLHDLLAQEGYFVTLLIAQYHPPSRELVLANGGHPAALKISPGACTALSIPRGPSLGITEDHPYGTHTTHLKENEALLLITDGVIEATDDHGAYFGQSRLAAFLESTAGPPWGSRLLAEVEDWQKGSGLYDDLTLLEIWVASQSPGS